MLEIPYVPKAVIEGYIAAHFYDEEHCVNTPGFEHFLSRLDCPNFNHRDAAICYLLGWSVEETDEALHALDDENRIEAEIADRDERAYHDDQRND